MLPGFVYLDEALPGACWDSKYFGCDNFMGCPADGYTVNRIVMAQETAFALKDAQAEFLRDGFNIFVFDAYRPARAVKDFCRWVAEGDDRRKALHFPFVNRQELISLGYIAAQSGHSRGGTVDLTLTENGQMLDMGGIFDFMDSMSAHGAPVTPKQAQNRAYLRSVMLKNGFTDYECEWWHYRLKNEPYPDTYFDFVIE